MNRNDDSLRLATDKIVIRASGGSMWSKDATCENLVLAPARGPKVSVEATVEFLPQNGGEQAGVVLFRDWNNYIKLVREMVRAEHVIVVAREIDGEPEAVLHEPCEASVVHFRLAAENDSIVAEWRMPSAEDIETRRFQNWLVEAAPLRPGLLVHGRNENNNAVFRSFKTGE